MRKVLTMAEKLSSVKLPNNSEYYIQDDSAVASISRSGTTCTITYRDGHTSIVHGLELEGGVLGFYIVDPDLEPDTDSDSDYDPNANKIFIPVSVPLSGSDTDGLMSYQDYLKLANIESGAEVNQFAFGKVRVSQVDDSDPKHPIVTSTDLDADDKVDTFEMMEGDNVTLVPNVPGDKVTIHAKDTTYILSYERSSEIDSDSDSDSETEVIYHNTIKLTNNLDITDVQTIPIQDDVIYKLTSDSRAGTITLYGSNGDTYTISVPYAGHATSADYADEAGHADLATADADSDTISETYATNIDIDSDSDGHYQHIIQLKNKQGNVIASVEVPDNDTTYTLEASSEQDSVIVFRGSDGTVSELATGKTYTLSTDSDGHIVLTSSTGDVYSVTAPNAEHADLADEALHSSEADYADEAGHSSDADHADLADEALHSSDADHALEADHSSDADHADLADEALHSSDADHATNADYANHAVEADHSSEADHATSSTYAGTANKAIADADSDDIRTTYAITIDVDRDSDDDITVGLKNKNGVLISTDTVPKATQSDSGLMSSSDKTKLDGIATGAQVNVIETVKVNGTPLTPDQYKAVDVTVPTKLTDLENDSDFVQDRSYVHTDNNYTTTEKNKLAGIASGAEVNQNAFSIVKITKATSASTSLSADSKTDTVEVVEGTNITLTPDASKDKFEISAKDTTYTLSQDPTDGHKFKLTNNLDGTDVQEITIPDSDTTYHVALDESTNSIMLVNDADSEDVSSIVPADATTTLHGYMSASDKVKLNGIATGAEVNQNAYSTVKVGSTNVSSSSKTGTLTLVEGANITLTPNTSDKSVTIASSYTNTTYTLTQDGTDGHKFTLSGTDGYSKTITIPDNNTTYTLAVGTGADADKLIFTPSSGTATKITVPFATNATNAVNATNDQSGNNIKSSYASSVDISGHTLTLKSKDGTTLSTKTLPDNDTTYTFSEGSTDKAFTVTPKGGTAQTVPIHGLGAASTKGVSSTVTDSDTNLVTGGAVATAIAEAIDNLPEPMIFKGTLGTNGTYTTLPTAGASTEGWTLKVITADTYPTGDSGTPKAKVGDMFICRKISSSSFEWVWIPSGDDVEDTWRGIKVDTVSKLGNGISTGALDFTSGNHIGLSFNSTGNKLTIAHADTSSQASVTNSGRTYIQGITLDGDGHVTGLTSATETVVNTDRYVNSVSFADDTSSDTDHPVKMTLTRAGSDSVKVEGNIPKVSSTSAGVAPKGASVSTQSQSTKFLREDGSWAKPSYTTNTDRYVNSASFAHDSTNSNMKMTLTRAGSDTKTVTANIPVVSSSTSGVAPKGNAVTTQTTSTKFLREDGSWAAPSYTENTDRYVNSASFADDTTASASSPVKMTLTRAGSDTATVTGNIPKVSSSSAGVAPKGTAVSSQSQSTKFLREDGTWAKPSYTTNTDTKVTSVGNHYTPAKSETKSASSDTATDITNTEGTAVIIGIEMDAKGHVTGIVSDKLKSVNTTYSQGTGISISGTTINHSNSVTAGTASEGGDTRTLTFGGTFHVPGVTYDAQGHITSTGSVTLTLPANPNTDTKVTSVGNHYSPSANPSSELSASATGATAAWGIDVVQGVQVQRDAKGHVTGITVTSGKIPSNPNTDEKVTQTETTSDETYELLFSGTADNTTRTEGARKSGNLTFNPSTGTLDVDRNVYTKAIYMSDSQSTPTQSNRFGWYQWGDQVQFTYRNSQNKYLGQAFAIYVTDGHSEWNKTSIYKASMYPNTTDTYYSGDANRKWKGVYATTFYGDLDGNASSASSAPWSGITDKPSTFPPSTHTHSQIVTVGDKRSISTVPTDYVNALIFQGLKSSSTIGSPSTDSYSYLVGLRGWSDSSGGNTHELAFNNSGVYRRQGATDTWGSWVKLIDSGNYTDYTVKKDGTGATGTWGINISGTAGGVAWSNVSDRPTKLSQFTNDITFATSIATSTGTNQITLEHGKKYAITAGGTSYVFTMPGDNNTTYTFEQGTNCFYVTPSGGSKQTVTVTPSIANNITGSGTSGYLAKFNGANTITNGPALGSSTTTFLRNDGTWATPTDTNNAVTQTATNTNATYEVLFSGTADNTTRTEGARKYSNLTFNPSTGTLTTTKVVSANATLGVADIDTTNITEGNVGNLIVTGAARFLNTINGSISGNAATATLAADSSKLNGYASDTSATNNTIARRTASGYIFATYFNQSSGAETPTSSSYVIYANSDGYFRKSSIANMKTAMSLNNVENKSSATIRGELTSANVTTALGYTPVNKAGDTMSGSLHFTSSAPLIYDWVHTTESPMIVLKDSPNYGIRYQEGDPDTMKFSASGNANTNNADLCINGAGDGTVTIRGNTIIHAGNYTSYTVKKDGTGASGTWGISISGNASTATNATNDANGLKIDTGYLKLSGGTMTGKITSNYNPQGSWLYCGQNPDIHINNTGASGWIGGNTKTGRHVICTYASNDDLLYFNWYSNTTLAGSTNKFDKSFTWNPATNILSTNISGNAATATTAQYVSLIASNEIRFANKPSSAVDVYFNYQWADGTASAMINKYVFMNGNKTKCPVEASKFIGPLQGNADTATSATSATKATQDGNGNVITSTYLPLAGGTMTGQIVLASTGYKTSSTSGYIVDQYGNFKHQSTNTGEYWVISNNAGTAKLSVYWESGNVTAAGNVTAPKFIGALQGNADTATKATQDANGDVISTTYRRLDDPNYGTINADEIATGNLSVTGVARFTGSMYGDLTGNADTATSATKATQDESGNNIKATYASSFSISDHTITLKNKNGASLGTVTVPDNNTTYTFAESTSNGYFTVTPSGGSAQSVKIHGLGTSAFKNTTDTYSETGTDPVTGKAVKQAIDSLPEPMIFKGTVGSSSATYTWDQLPTPGASNEGWTFKAIEDHATAPICKNGDTLISNGLAWVIVPSGDEPSGTVTSVAIANGGGLSVSGSPITSSGTITISHSDTSSQASVSNSGRTYIQSVTLDTYGHVTKLTSATETVTDTNYYHKTGTWSGLTYTAAKVGSPDDLAFTIPTGTTATTVALGNHNHDGIYLKLSGGTMTGVLALKGSQYEDSYSGALNANNSNIYNLNSLYTADAADAASEGIHFYRDATHVDSLWVTGGDIMFVPNRELGTSTTAANSQKVGRFTANPTSGQVVITDGTTGGMKSSGYTIASSVPANAKFTDTTYSAGDNMTLSSTTFYATKRWTAITQGLKWSRILLVENSVGTVGNSGLLHVCCTRGNVVCNSTFIINTSHASYGQIHQISSNNYSKFKIRLLVNSSGYIIVDIYDTANSIASGTTQSWYCSYLSFQPATVTTYTAFTDDSTIPSGYTSNGEMETVTGNDTSAIRSITRNGTTFTATRQNGTTFTFTQQDSNDQFTLGTSGNSVVLSKNGAAQNTITVPYATSAGNASTVNNLTVQTAVPANAKFTDTNYYHTTGSWSGLTYTATANGGAGALAFTIPIGTSATTVAVGNHNHDGTYVKVAGDSMTGTLCMNSTNGNYGEGIRINSGNGGYSSLTIGTEANSTSGISDKGFWIGTNTTNSNYMRKLYIAHNSSTASTTYFYASSASDTSPSLQVGGAIVGRGVVCANAANSSTAGGLALYGTSPTDYGIAFRGTGNGGKHGYVQGDWAQYHYMTGADNRGWVFNSGASTGVASINKTGNMVLNGSLTVGGNATNTSGMRLEWNASTKSLDFIAVA